MASNVKDFGIRSENDFLVYYAIIIIFHTDTFSHEFCIWWKKPLALEEEKHIYVWWIFIIVFLCESLRFSSAILWITSNSFVCYDFLSHKSYIIFRKNTFHQWPFINEKQVSIFVNIYITVKINLFIVDLETNSITYISPFPLCWCEWCLVAALACLFVKSTNWRCLLRERDIALS